MKKIIEKKVKKILLASIALMILYISTNTGIASNVAYAADSFVTIKVEQVFVTNAEMSTAVFTYMLNPLDANNPMPSESSESGYSFSILGNGYTEIGPIRFLEQGAYYYEIQQVITADNPNYSYDKRVFSVEIHVDERINAYVVIFNEAGDKEESIVFHNAYKNGNGGSPEPPEPTTEPTTEPPEPPEPPGPAEPPEPPIEPPPAIEPPDGGDETDITDPDIPEGEFPNEGPKTGDDTNTAFDMSMLIIGVMLVSGAASFLIASKRRRKG